MTDKRPIISAMDLLRGPESPDQPVITGGLDLSIPVVDQPITVIGKYGHQAIVQPRDGYIRLWVADETGRSTSAVLLKPEAAERLARILTQTKAIVEIGSRDPA